jgi:hypothetical protein
LVPDTVNLIIWLIAGVAGGNVIGDFLLKGSNIAGNTAAGAIGGIAGGLVLQALIPTLRGIDYVPIIGQAVAAAISGAALSVVAEIWRQRRG